MKKTFLTCMAIVALLALASSAGAITCTIDQRPAATLLIPYFQATFGDKASNFPIIGTGATALDTLVTIGNASSAPMLAHVSIYSDRTELVLDFNIALTGFDIQSFSVASVLRGFLPVTPINQSHVSEVKDTNQVTINGDVCQRNSAAPVYPAAGGFLRVRPTVATANALDNTSATVSYLPGPFPLAFLQDVIDSLDFTHDSRTCDGGTDGVITNPIHGYIVIDHVNYCTIANPDNARYWTTDAAGFENNLFGDYIFTSGAGVGTEGFPAVAIEADPSLADASQSPTDLTPVSGNPCAPGTADCVGRRTFYRRYIQVADTVGCVNPMPAPQNAWDCGFGDEREPLGLKYAARWFDTAGVTSNFNVWRASSVPDTVDGGLMDLLGFPVDPVAKCNTSEPNVGLAFYDEDENTAQVGVCPSPPVNCIPSTFNFPLETQRVSITGFAHPAWPAGWVSMEFFNGTGPAGGALDQAYVTYDFQGPTAFLSAGIPAAQLDPTNCQPLKVPVFPAVDGVTPTAPVIPVIVGTGPAQ